MILCELSTIYMLLSPVLISTRAYYWMHIEVVETVEPPMICACHLLRLLMVRCCAEVSTTNFDRWFLLLSSISSFSPPFYRDVSS
jgi:hypothetical protein